MTTYNLIHKFGISPFQTNFRDFTGHDEKHISLTKNLPSFKRSIYLLNRLIKFPKDYSHLTDSERIDKIFNFSIGYRSSLTLYLRQLLFGDTLQCLVNCPDCKSEMSLDLLISTILQLNPSFTKLQTLQEIKVDNFMLQIRPLNGHDQETLFSFNIQKEDPKTDIENGNDIDENSRFENLSKLAKLCIVKSDPPIDEHDKLSANVISAISDKVEQMDPISNIILSLTCYKCKHHFQTPFYAEEYVLHEIDLRGHQLEWEIHWIAFNYHWSEKEILSLSMKQRKNYIELINKTLSD